MPLPAIYCDDAAARDHMEALLWPNGPVCPRCKTNDQARITKLKGKSTRPGVYKCKDCRKPFSVTVGTVFERSHIPLHQWVYAIHLLNSSKKGISAHQLSRQLKIDFKSAWFMAHRIREAMRPLGLEPPMGGDGEIVEADETYFGKPEIPHVSKQRKGRPYIHPKVRNSRPILSLVHRGGRVRSFHIGSADKETVQTIVRANVARESRLHTDESRLYSGADLVFASHETVRHTAKEYVRGDVHTNSAEGFFSIFKRGMKGIYQHCREKHLHRYLAEFDFRYNHRIALGFNDEMRAALAIQGAAGKRLTYKGTY